MRQNNSAGYGEAFLPRAVKKLRQREEKLRANHDGEERFSAAIPQCLRHGRVTTEYLRQPPLLLVRQKHRERGNLSPG